MCSADGWSSAHACKALYDDESSTLDELRESVETLEDTARIARRVLGNSNPMTKGIEGHLRVSRATLRARETLSGNH